MSVLTISKPLLDVFVGADTEGIVYSTFSRACNMRFGNKLIGLVSEDLGANPFSIVISWSKYSLWKRFIRRGMKVVLGPSEMRIGSGVLLNLKSSSVWDPDFSVKLERVSSKKALVNLEKLLVGFQGEYSVLDTTYEYFHQTLLHKPSQNLHSRPFIKILDVLFNQENVSNGTLEKSASDLIGFGRGLTPSGDDFISGLVGLLNIAEKSEILSKAVLRQLSTLNQCVQSHILSNKTTMVSNMLLMSAVNGWFSEKVGDFLLALLERKKGLKISFEEVLSIGHHSGSDILAGIYTGLQLLNKRNNLCQIQ